MKNTTIGVVNYTPKKDFYIVGDNKTEKSGITDPLYAGEITIQYAINGTKVKEIGSNAFRNCSLITKVTILAKLTVINEKAFIFCSSLEYINIPQTVTFIGRSAINIRTINNKIIDIKTVIEFNEGRKAKLYFDSYSIARRKTFIIIYPSTIEPLYNTSNQFEDVDSAIICSPKSFQFCNRFPTTTNMSACPPQRFKLPYVSHAQRKDIQFKVIVCMIIIILC